MADIFEEEEAQVYPVLYSTDSKGKVRTWGMERIGDRYRTISGTLGGKHTVTGWTTCEAKNEGRANATTPDQQAHQEVLAEYEKKKKRKYYENLEDADGGAKYFEPMLAKEFDAKKQTFPCYAQPKLDGIRCILKADGAWTRKGEPITSIPHIVDGLKGLFAEYPAVILDGELYNHDLKEDFNEIASMVRKKYPDELFLFKTAELVQYHVYDLPSARDDFSGRNIALNVLRSHFPDSVRLVQTIKAESQSELDIWQAAWLQDGYEGQMVRNDTPYEKGKRTKNLLKRKEWTDGEFPISRILEGNGNWAGFAKMVEFILPNDHRDENGDRPKAGIKGNKAFCKALLDDREKYQQVKVKFFNFTPAGIPRFPIAIDWFEDERKD